MSSSYYLFSNKPIEEARNINTIFLGRVTIPSEKIKRFALLGLPSETELLVYEAIPSEVNYGTALENGYYRSDCNMQIAELLQDNVHIYGSSSACINGVLSEIVRVRKSTNTILFKGDNGWSSLKSLFETLSSSAIKYVVLRKFETLPDRCLENDHDIDILCESKSLVLLATGAEKRSIGISGYSLLIGGIKTDFDIRYLGDDYLDSSWQKDILDNRITHNKCVYVMDETNLLFSLLYHNLTQKKEISDYYVKQIKELSRRILGIDAKCDRHELCELLSSYMKVKSYQVRKPHDVGVVQNKANIRTIKKLLRPCSAKTIIIRNSYIRTPYSIRRFLPRVVKKKMNKYE